MLVGKMECYTRTEPARPALARVDTASFKFSTNTGTTRTEPPRPALARGDTASFKFSTNTGTIRTEPSRPEPARPAQESLHLVGVEAGQPKDHRVHPSAEVRGVALHHARVVALQDADGRLLALFS